MGKMNALELANCIDEDILIDYGQVSDMLRQQQAEIEASKEQLEDCTCQGGHSQAYLKAKGKAQEK